MVTRQRKRQRRPLMEIQHSRRAPAHCTRRLVCGRTSHRARNTDRDGNKHHTNRQQPPEQTTRCTHRYSLPHEAIHNTLSAIPRRGGSWTLPPRRYPHNTVAVNAARSSQDLAKHRYEPSTGRRGMATTSRRHRSSAAHRKERLEARASRTHATHSVGPASPAVTEAALPCGQEQRPVASVIVTCRSIRGLVVDCAA